MFEFQYTSIFDDKIWLKVGFFFLKKKVSTFKLILVIHQAMMDFLAIVILLLSYNY